jgi:hypothetical protein
LLNRFLVTSGLATTLTVTPLAKGLIFLALVGVIASSFAWLAGKAASPLARV